MKTSMMAMAAASLAMVATGPALAQQTGKQTRTEARQNSQGPANANPQGVQRSNENSVLNGGSSMQDRDSMRRQNSQGRNNASDRGRERANQNSAIATPQPGMMVHDRSDRMVGTVREVRRSPTGVLVAIVVVLVVQVNGSNVVTLPAGSFTIVNNIIVVNNINIGS